MEAKLMLVIVAVVAGFALCVEGQRCCTPDQWEGVQSSLTGYVYKRRPGTVYGLVYVSYDYTNRQSAALANYTASRLEKPRAYRIVRREAANKNEGKVYIVDLQSDKCYVKKSERPFRQACVPDEAKEEGSFYFGAGDDTLKSRGYRVSVESEKYRLFIGITVTEQCIPVGELVTGNARGVPMMESVGFVDIKAGIKDPSVFDVPQECQEDSTAFELLTGLDHEYSIFAF